MTVRKVDEILEEIADNTGGAVSGTVELGATSLAALESITASGPLTDAQLTTQLAALAILLEHTFVSQEAATVPVATTMQSAATANGNGTSLPVTGYATAILQITGMSGGVTVVDFEGSADGGTTWVAVIAHQLGASGSQATSTTADGDFRINCAGLSHIRARLSAYSAGTVTVKGYASPVAGPASTVGVSNQATGTDRSGTIATGGTAQNAAGALGARKYLYLENPITATERLWFDYTATAVADSPSISLEPGQSWENPSHFCPTGAISVIAATTSHKFTAKEG